MERVRYAVSRLLARAAFRMHRYSIRRLSHAEWRRRRPMLCFGCFRYFDRMRPLGDPVYGAYSYSERCPRCEGDALARVS